MTYLTKNFLQMHHKYVTMQVLFQDRDKLHIWRLRLQKNEHLYRVSNLKRDICDICWRQYNTSLSGYALLNALKTSAEEYL